MTAWALPRCVARAACPQTPDVLHLATLSAVLACLMRHFRASLASLPLLAQPLVSLPVGTWAPDAPAAMQADMLPDAKDTRRQWRRIMPLHTVTAATPLTQARARSLPRRAGWEGRWEGPARVVLFAWAGQAGGWDGLLSLPGRPWMVRLLRVNLCVPPRSSPCRR